MMQSLCYLVRLALGAHGGRVCGEVTDGCDQHIALHLRVIQERMLPYGTLHGLNSMEVTIFAQEQRA